MSKPFTSLDEFAPRRGADVLVDVLRSEGVRHVFGNPGTTELPVLEALTGVTDIAYVLGLQETSVVAMADGYAQASGRPGFVNLHTAGGLGHATGAILNAQIARTPLVITAGQQDTRHAVLEPLLFGNLTDIARPNVKWAQEILHPEHIPLLLRRAFQDSSAAPAGPVFLSLPVDVMERETTVATGVPAAIHRQGAAGSLDVLASKLASIAPGRLAIVVEEDVLSARAEEEAVALAETLGAPVFGASWPGHLAFPTRHPLWQGALPPKHTDIHERLMPFEGILVLGGQALVAYQYSDGPAVPAHCRLFHLSSDGRQPGRFQQTEMGCVGDLKASLKALRDYLEPALSPHAKAIEALRMRAGEQRDAARRALAERFAGQKGAEVITPLVAAHEVVRAVGPSIAIVDESPVTMAHVRACLNSHSAQQYLFTRSAILGWAMPAAVGTSLGLDRQPVVALIGDGSAMYSPQALWTAAHERLPVTFVIMNNCEYNILKNYARAQPHYRSSQLPGMDLTDPAIDFLALAAAMGLPGRRVTRAQEIAEAVEAGIASERPNLVEIVVGAG